MIAKIAPESENLPRFVVVDGGDGDGRKIGFDSDTFGQLSVDVNVSTNISLLSLTIM
jgi:hypothetical protein